MVIEYLLDAVLVTSSHSTDETVIPDSDVEVDTAASNHISPSAKLENVGKYDNNDVVKYEHYDVNVDADISAGEAKLIFNARGGNFIQNKHDADAIADGSTYKSHFLSSRIQDSSLKEGDSDLGTSADQNADIIYDHNLIVKKMPVNVRPALKKKDIDFKHFRKVGIGL